MKLPENYFENYHGRVNNRLDFTFSKKEIQQNHFIFYFAIYQRKDYKVVLETRIENVNQLPSFFNLLMRLKITQKYIILFLIEISKSLNFAEEKIEMNYNHIDIDKFIEDLI